MKVTESYDSGCILILIMKNMRKMVLWAKRLGYRSETTRVGNRGETTRGETTRGETSWGETTCYQSYAERGEKVGFLLEYKFYSKRLYDPGL